MSSSDPYDNYEFVSSKRALASALKTIGAGPCALDFETTSLSATAGRVRLVQLYDGEHGYVVDFDRIKGGFRACAHLFGKGEWIVFNSGFEQRWFNAAGASHVLCRDVAFLRCARLGGGRSSLLNAVEWDLGREMDKTEQTSDWSAEVLTRSQLRYAFRDAVDTWDLYRYWVDQSDDRIVASWHMFDDMLPGVIEMEEAGMVLDVDRHAALVEHWSEIQAGLIDRIRAIIPEDDLANINSDVQWSDFFLILLDDATLSSWPQTPLTGQLSMKSEILRTIAVGYEQANGENPMTELLLALADYKKISKYISSFGDTLINKALMNKQRRVHARFNIAAAKTGRFSSSGPNLQQIPNDLDLLGEATSVRSSFIAPRGRRLVSLDYSGIELRVLALLAGDEQLLEDVVFGDVHSEVAAVIAGHAIDKSTPEGYQARRAAKAVSFGIIYGSGAGGLSVTMRTSTRKAQGYIDFWRERYGNAFDYRNVMMREAVSTRYIRVIDGGTIYMGKNPDLPKCANYPVQRAALSVMARAISRHKDTLDDARAGGKQARTLMLSTIHDALIDEADTRDAKRCLKMMERDMVEAYLDVFPGAPTDNLVEGGIGVSWGALD